MIQESRLIEFYKTDIESILKHVNEDENNFIYSFINSIEKTGKFLYYIEIDIVEDLINQYCYNIWDEENPMERVIPDNRLSLFKQIFIGNVNFMSKRTMLWHQHGSYYSVEMLYLLLFYYLFMQIISTELPIEIHFKKALSDWKNALKSKRMPITIYMELLATTLNITTEKFRMSEDLELEKLRGYKALNGHSRFQLSRDFHLFHNIILRHSSFEKFDHNFDGNFSSDNHSMENFLEDYREMLIKIQYFMISFYLQGFFMIREGIEIFYPWWVSERSRDFKTSEIHIEDIQLNLDDLNQLKELYEKVLKYELFKDKELNLIMFYYNEVQNKTRIFDLILNDFIILESIFARDVETESTFRLSLNLASFIAESKNDFIQIFEITKKLYRIRSKIIHGEDWNQYLLKKKIPENLGLDGNSSREEVARAVHKQLILYINKALIKILNLKINKSINKENTNILKDFKNLYFLLNSNMFDVENE